MREQTGAHDLVDPFGRVVRDLRISVTDRCNFRCTYCMPKEVYGRDYAFLPRDQVLSFEEIERAARAFVGLGVRKLRLTGGEPLVKRDLPDLVAMLAALRTPEGEPLDLTLTTNGAALRALARPLRDAGLQRITVSLDSLDDAVFGAKPGQLLVRTNKLGEFHRLYTLENGKLTPITPDVKADVEAWRVDRAR